MMQRSHEKIVGLPLVQLVALGHALDDINRKLKSSASLLNHGVVDYEGLDSALRQIYWCEPHLRKILASWHKCRDRRITAPLYFPKIDFAGRHVMSDKPYSKYAILNERPIVPAPSEQPRPILKTPDAPVVAPPLVRPSGSTSGSSKNFEQKSSAQVEAWVAPRRVQPKSGGLKPKRRNRSHPLGIRFIGNELAMVRTKAKVAGYTVNAYVRAAALGSDYKPPIDPELRKVLLALNRELTRQGTNLNQIAKHLNSGQLSPSHGETMLDVLNRSMLKTHMAVRHALTREPAP